MALTRESSFVYLVGYAPHPEVLFVKIGKADSPKERLKAYRTHLPGGPSFMLCAGISSSDRAYIQEAAMLSFALSCQHMKPMGGEWFASSVEGVEIMLGELRKLSQDVFEVELGEPARIARGRHAGRPSEQTKRRRVWKEQAEQHKGGVSSGFNGPQRG